MTYKSRSDLQRQIFFDKSVHLQPVKDCISGNNEESIIQVLKVFDFELGRDYFRQYPIGSRFVLDFAFVNEQVAIEVDGDSHLQKQQKRKDNIRDKFLLNNNWITIRILDKDFNGFKGSFYKSLIKLIIDERRTQYESGRLYPIEFPRFVEEDYI